MRGFDTSYYDSKELKDVTEALFDEHRESMTEKNLREMAELTAKWACYMGDRVKFNGKIYEMAPIPQRIGPNLMWPIMAQLFENQVLNNPQPKSLYEATTTSNVSLPDKFTLPVIREIFPQMIMFKICSVQPMPPSSGGTGKAFWWKTYREDVSPETQLTVNDSDYALSGESQVPKRIRGGLSNVSVTAITDKLAASWTQELQEDLMGVMGIDINSEMLNAMSGEILREMEQRVLKEMENGASAGNTDWHYTVGEGHTNKEWYETLFDAILDADEDLLDGRYQDSNVIIGGTAAVTYMLKSQRFTAAAKTSDQYAGPISSGTRFEGTYNGRWDVYRTPLITSSKLLVTYYPTDRLHSGYVYMPYVPIMPMPKVYADMKPYNDTDLAGGMVNNDSWTQNVRTRNGKYFAEPGMFATVTVTS